MLKNNIKIAWRNLVKDRQFTILNLLGLSTGLACTLLIYLWVNDELQVDKFNAKDSRLYYVMKNQADGEGHFMTGEHTQGLLAKSMAAELPEVEYAVAVRKESGEGVLASGEKHIKATAAFVDKDFLNVFSYPLLEGNKDNVFADKYGVLLSDKFALKLFGSTTNIIGKTISWDHGDHYNGAYNIAGVYKAAPSNASDQFDIIFNYTLFAEKEAGGMGDISFWGSNSVHTYVLLKEGVNAEQFNRKIKGFSKAKIKALYKDPEMLKYEGDLFAQRYSEGYLYNHIENGKATAGRIQYVKLFSFIAIFILAIACINFMNLSTAKASRRLKEIGVKKVVGASRGSLALQYLTESVLMSFLSLLIAISLVIVLLPQFNQLTGKQITIHFSVSLIMAVFAITLLTGIIAGAYPALYLSGFNAIAVLKGKLTTSVGELIVRKGLVVFQFALSAIFIVTVLVVYKQMDLIRTKNLGYNKDNIIHFSNAGNLGKRLVPFLAEAKKIPGVVNASSMEGDMLGNAGHSGGGISWEGKDPKLGIEYYGIGVNYDLLETLGLKMKEGRTFSKTFGADDAKVIFNESAIAAMGLKDPIGKTVSMWGKPNQVIGVVKDFHFASLYKKVGPAFFYYSDGSDPDFSSVVIKIKAGNEKKAIAGLTDLYKQYNQGIPFEYKFLDEDYQRLYASEQRVAVLSAYAAALAVIISCLGLFGLAAFTAQKRQKEIGIRKVVGASVGNIALLLSKDFLQLVLLAALIAFPLSWWIMNEWLLSFAYRIQLGAGVFLMTGFAVAFITLVTISFQAIKAALANPVKSLRSE